MKIIFTAFLAMFFASANANAADYGYENGYDDSADLIKPEPIYFRGAKQYGQEQVPFYYEQPEQPVEDSAASGDVMNNSTAADASSIAYDRYGNAILR